MAYKVELPSEGRAVVPVSHRDSTLSITDQIVDLVQQDDKQTGRQDDKQAGKQVDIRVQGT